MSTTEILVCTTCRPSPREGDTPPAGGVLLEALTEVMAAAGRAGAQNVPQLRGIACLSGCKRACTMALQAAGKHTYVFGDLQADAETAVQVLACAVLHQASPDGSLPRDARPPLLRKGILAKLPPLQGVEPTPPVRAGSVPTSDNLGAADRRPPAKGWCPTAHRPMASGDGLLLRVRPRLGRLTLAQALGLCDTASRFGSGAIELTHRANLQLRGLREAQYPQALAELAALGLVDADPALEERRNIVVTPLWRAGDDTEALATELAARLGEFPALPAKFGFAVDTGPATVLGDVSADIRIERGRSGGLIVRADGAGEGLAVAPSSAIEAALALASWFAATASTTRMKSHLATHALPAALAPHEPPAPPAALPLPGPSAHGPVVGAAFGQVPAAALARLLQDSGASALRVAPNRTLLLEGARCLPQAFASDRDGGNAAPNLSLDESTHTARIDARATVHATADFLTAGDDASEARAMVHATTDLLTAGVDAVDARATVHATTDFLTAGVDAVEAHATVHATTDFLTAGDDPLLRVDACPGAPACAAATVETRRLARSLAPLLARADAAGPPRSLHVSGCAKGCARARPADLMLVGRTGAFDLVRGGRAWDAPCATGVPPKALPALIGTP